MAAPATAKVPGSHRDKVAEEVAGQADPAGQVTSVLVVEAAGQYSVGVRGVQGAVQAAVVSPVVAPYPPGGQGRQDSSPPVL